MKFKATIVVIYDADPEHYAPAETVEDMLAIDRENLEAEPHAFLDFDNVTTTLEEYKD
jgi:hypothetical protein